MAKKGTPRRRVESFSDEALRKELEDLREEYEQADRIAAPLFWLQIAESDEEEQKEKMN